METTTWTVGEAIDAFYRAHDFGEDGGANQKWVWIQFGFFSIPIPNSESRRKNVYLHDVNHILTGYDTSWKGESAVSAWEVASGGWGILYIPWLLTLWAMGLGVVFYPGSVWQAFKRGRITLNAYTSGLRKEELFRLTVRELKQKLTEATPQLGSPRSVYPWMLVSAVVFLGPLVIAVGVALSFIG